MKRKFQLCIFFSKIYTLTFSFPLPQADSLRLTSVILTRDFPPNPTAKSQLYVYPETGFFFQVLLTFPNALHLAIGIEIYWFWMTFLFSNAVLGKRAVDWRFKRKFKRRCLFLRHTYDLS